MFKIINYLKFPAAIQAKHNSMLSGMFSFMKQSRKNAPEGLYLADLDAEGMDPEVFYYIHIYNIY